MVLGEAAYAELSMAESHDDKAVQSGHWVGMWSRHNKGVYSTLCFETSWNIASRRIVLNKAIAIASGSGTDNSTISRSFYVLNRVLSRAK